MTKTAPTAKTIWADFQTLPPASKNEFLKRLIADESTRREIEDLLDFAIVHERAHEPDRSLDDVLAELGK